MIQNKRKYLYISGAVFITLMMTFSANAENITKSAEPNPLSTCSVNDVYVDENIFLTAEEHLSDIQTAANEIEDNEYKALLQEIISIIESKGFVNSDDIRNILLDLEMYDVSAFTGVGVQGNAGISALCKGLPFISRGAGCRLHLFAPIVYMNWDVTGCYGNIDFTIRGENYDGKEHTGLAIGGIGYWEQEYIQNGESGTSEFHIKINTVGHFLLFINDLSHSTSSPKNKKAHMGELPMISHILETFLEKHRFPVLEKILIDLKN